MDKQLGADSLFLVSRSSLELQMEALGLPPLSTLSVSRCRAGVLGRTCYSNFSVPSSLKLSTTHHKVVLIDGLSVSVFFFLSLLIDFKWVCSEKDRVCFLFRGTVLFECKLMKKSTS